MTSTSYYTKKYKLLYYIDFCFKFYESIKEVRHELTSDVLEELRQQYSQLLKTHFVDIGYFLDYTETITPDKPKEMKMMLSLSNQAIHSVMRKKYRIYLLLHQMASDNLSIIFGCPEEHRFMCHVLKNFQLRFLNMHPECVNGNNNIGTTLSQAEDLFKLVRKHDQIGELCRLSFEEYQHQFITISSQ